MVDLTLYIVTFNCGRALIEPAAFGRHLFDNWQDPSSTNSDGPDVVVLNLQEIAPLSYAFLNSMLVKPYFDRFRQAVDVATQETSPGSASSRYLNVVSRNAGLIGIMVFVREDVVDEIQYLNIAEVGVGLSKMGNKGAIGARIGWKTSGEASTVQTIFVSAHLAPFEEEIERRNQDYIDIVRGLVFTEEDAREWRKDQQGAENVPLLASESEEVDLARGGSKGIYSNNTHLFFSGDLNYRTALTTPARDDPQHFPQPQEDIKHDLHYSHLLEKDQLTQQMQQGKTLHGMKEQPIDFPPTYKYQLTKETPVLIDTDIEEWKWASHRWPSWCDRILFSPTQVKAGRYNALPLFRTSDHRPVSLSASIPLQQVSGSDLAEKAPARVDQDYKSNRDAARRKEIVVGTGAYLSLTWEGNILTVGLVLFVLGSIWATKSM